MPASALADSWRPGLGSSLQIGVATSGYYVKHARSPRLDDLKKFLRTCME